MSELKSEHRLYHVWVSMRQRCNNEKCDGYPLYGGRGIKVCEEWDKDYEPFFEWCISNGWQVGKVIDRKDNNLGYSPDNCRFVTQTASLRNKRNVKQYDINGQSRTLREWAAYYDIPYTLLYSRMVTKGLTILEAINEGKKSNVDISVRNQRIKLGRTIKQLIKDDGRKIAWVVDKMEKEGFNISLPKFSLKLRGVKDFFVEKECEFIKKLISNS